MRETLRGRPGPGEGGDAELDVWLSETWEDATAAVGRLLDLRAGKEALLASSEILREGNAKLTAPARMTHRVAPRRHRYLRLRSARGAAALAACAVALVAAVAVGVSQRRDITDVPVVNTAYVAKRVDSALNAAEPAAIAQMTVTTRGPDGTTTAEEWSFGDKWRTVTNSPAGYPAYDQGLSGSVYTVVSYPMRAWGRRHSPAGEEPGPRGCEPGVNVVPLPGPAGRFDANLLPGTVAKALRAALSCGSLAVAGEQRVDGIEAIKLTSRPGSLSPETIWISPSTYLPVRVVASTRTGRGVFRQTADISWLPPAAQNLAKLTVPIPAGFRQVSALLILRQMRTR